MPSYGSTNFRAPVLLNELVDEALGTGKLFKAGNRSVGDDDGNAFSHGLVQYKGYKWY